MANSSNSSEDNIEMEWVDNDAAIAFLALSMIMCIANGFLLCLLIKMIQRQDVLIEKVLVTYAKFNFVCTPIVSVLLYGLIGLLPISTLVGNWFCDITFFLFYFWDCFNADFSFILVTARFSDSKIDKFFVTCKDETISE